MMLFLNGLSVTFLQEGKLCDFAAGLLGTQFEESLYLAPESMFTQLTDLQSVKVYSS